MITACTITEEALGADCSLAEVFPAAAARYFVMLLDFYLVSNATVIVTHLVSLAVSLAECAWRVVISRCWTPL